MMKIKIQFRNDIHRWHQNGIQNYQSLLHFVKDKFKFVTEEEFHIQFEDEENDRLTISSEPDFNDALSCAREEGRKSLKLFISKKEIEHINIKNDNINHQSTSHPQAKDKEEEKEEDFRNDTKQKDSEIKENRKRQLNSILEHNDNDEDNLLSKKFLSANDNNINNSNLRCEKSIFIQQKITQNNEKNVLDANQLITRFIHNSSFLLLVFFLAVHLFCDKTFIPDISTKMKFLVTKITSNKQLKRKSDWEQELILFLNENNVFLNFPFYHLMKKCARNIKTFISFFSKEFNLAVDSCECLHLMATICDYNVGEFSDEEIVVYGYIHTFENTYSHEHIKTLRKIKRSGLCGRDLYGISFEKFVKKLDGNEIYEEEDRCHLRQIYNLLCWDKDN